MEALCHLPSGIIVVISINACCISNDWDLAGIKFARVLHDDPLHILQHRGFANAQASGDGNRKPNLRNALLTNIPKRERWAVCLRLDLLPSSRTMTPRLKTACAVTITWI